MKNKTTSKRIRSESYITKEGPLCGTAPDGSLIVNPSIHTENISNVVFYSLRTFVDIGHGKRVFEIVGSPPLDYMDSFVASLKKGIIVRTVKL